MSEHTTPQGAPSDHRSQPRRRGEELVGAVFSAVLSELTDNGYGALTMDAVAARAKVSKASLYRRWPGKRDLVLAAVQRALPDPDDLADTGSLRGDLLAYFTQTATYLQGPAGPALRGILGDLLGDPAGAAEVYSAKHRGRSAARLETLLRRAVARQEVPATRLRTVTPRQLEAGHAVLRHHYLWEGRLEEQLCAQIVDDIVLPLLSFTPDESRPGPSLDAVENPSSASAGWGHSD